MTNEKSHSRLVRELSVIKDLVLVFSLLPLFAQASPNSKTLPESERCGETRLTQWKINFKNQSIKKYADVRFLEQFCEPEALSSTTAAQVIFLDAHNRLVWSREIQIPRQTSFDSVEKGHLRGEILPLNETIIQIKFPQNSKTREAVAVKLTTQDGREFGPVAL